MATKAKGIDDSIIQLFAEHKTALHEKFHVESLAIFGSVSRGSADTAILIFWSGIRKLQASSLFLT